MKIAMRRIILMCSAVCIALFCKAIAQPVSKHGKSGTSFTAKSIDELGQLSCDRTIRVELRRKAIVELLKVRLPKKKTLAEAMDIIRCFKWVEKKDREVVRVFAGADPFGFTEFKPIIAIAFNLAWGKGTNDVDICFIALPSKSKITDDELDVIFRGECPQRLRDTLIVAVAYIQTENK
ncbi:MAG: hypothetical protein ABL962_04980 [Fimbriimonadaceae bacterium]